MRKAESNQHVRSVPNASNVGGGGWNGTTTNVPSPCPGSMVIQIGRSNASGSGAATSAMIAGNPAGGAIGEHSKHGATSPISGMPHGSSPSQHGATYLAASGITHGAADIANGDNISQAARQQKMRRAVRTAKQHSPTPTPMSSPIVIQRSGSDEGPRQSCKLL